MANKNIDDLPTATSLNAGDKLEILQGGTNKQIDVSLLSSTVIPTLQQVITESSTVDGVIATSLDGLGTITVSNGSISVDVSDGTNTAQSVVTPTVITHGVNSTTQTISDGNIDFTTPSLKKNSVELATVNDIVQVNTSTIGAAINGASSATPNDTDLVMSVESSVAKKNTWTQIKTFLKNYFDTLYESKPTIIDYSATSTYSGWSSFTIQKIFGIDYPLYTIWTVEVSGTSDSAFATVTLSYTQNAAYPNIQQSSYVTNNGVNSSAGRVQLLAGTNIIQWALTAGGGGFTAAGTKTVRCQIIVYK